MFLFAQHLDDGKNGHLWANPTLLQREKGRSGRAEISPIAPQGTRNYRDGAQEIPGTTGQRILPFSKEWAHKY